MKEKAQAIEMPVAEKKMRFFRKFRTKKQFVDFDLDENIFTFKITRELAFWSIILLLIIIL